MGNSKAGWYADTNVARLAANNPLNNNPFKTRQDMQQAMADLFKPIKPHYSAGGARLQLAANAAIYDIAAAELEGFSRPLWGIAPLVAGGGEFADFDIYLNGFTSGTDPNHPEYWGGVNGYRPAHGRNGRHRPSFVNDTRKNMATTNYQSPTKFGRLAAVDQSISNTQ